MGERLEGPGYFLNSNGNLNIILYESRFWPIQNVEGARRRDGTGKHGVWWKSNMRGFAHHNYLTFL
jgi:hypothetical protein